MVIDESQVDRFADFLRALPGIKPFDFCSGGEGVLFPPRGAPGAIELFFFATAHQFGFWSLEQDRYAGPMVARVDGKAWKGSDYLVRCLMRAWQRDRDFFNPARLSDLDPVSWDGLFVDDSGRNPLPMWREHLEICVTYSRWFRKQSTTPAEIIRQSNADGKPLHKFLDLAGQIPGYREDRLRKKLMLLAVILENRPEHFLRVTDPESYEPIIDYHLQRSALRTGLVRVTDPAFREQLEARKRVSPSQENLIRKSVYDAIKRLVDRSGLSVAAVDYFFFTNRTRCPEMSEPDCPACPVKSICTKHTRLFQPVYRTVDY